MVLAGSLCISASAVFVKLSGTSAGTPAFFRCAIALIVLAPLALAERRTAGPRAWRLRRLDLAAGVLLGIDYVFWAAAIHSVGASIATVVVNIQVVLFPLLARVFTRTPVPRRFVVATPVMLLGVALASGAVGAPAAGSAPVTGAVFGLVAGFGYAGYLFLMRLGGGQGHTVGPVCTSTAAAAGAAALLGGAWTGIDFSLDARAWGWLTMLALVGQVLAWLVMTPALPRLAPNVGAALLLLQPVMAIGLGVAVGERPTASQFGGCVLVVLVVWGVGRGSGRRGARSGSQARTDAGRTQWLVRPRGRR
ncbi:transporter [Streptomyces griseoflavus]|uniref:DMT family transporter n=1 Tax=Streptomyces rimosus TaxID=1927 RepID=UPI00067D832D|nr:DMT family transporter [Streptomyces rimosus]KOG52969.1 transporter [Streptomyces griseoflavus]